MEWPIYGFFPGGDPRLFRPDIDACTSGEIAAHQSAVCLWDVRDILGLPQEPELAACRHIPGLGRMIIARYGIGTYSIECCDICMEPACACDDLTGAPWDEEDDEDVDGKDFCGSCGALLLNELDDNCCWSCGEDI